MTPEPAVDLAVGDRYVCALLADGRVACAGDDNVRQLGAILPFEEAPAHWRCGNKGWSEARVAIALTPVGW